MERKWYQTASWTYFLPTSLKVNFRGVGRGRRNGHTGSWTATERFVFSVWRKYDFRILELTHVWVEFDVGFFCSEGFFLNSVSDSSFLIPKRPQIKPIGCLSPHRVITQSRKSVLRKSKKTLLTTPATSGRCCSPGSTKRISSQDPLCQRTTW